MTAPVISQQISQPIAMTAPVVSQQVDTSTYEVSFLMPKEYTMQTLPIPNDKRIHIHQVNPKTIAVVSFARYATESNITTYRNKLLD
jgi:SOUL heme-binding protein